MVEDCAQTGFASNPAIATAATRILIVMARLLRGSYPGQTAALPAIQRAVAPFDPGLLLARLRVGDGVGKIVVGIVEHLHFGGAIVSVGVAPGVALGARRDAALVGA